MSAWFIASLVCALIALILAVVTNQIGSPTLWVLFAIWVAVVKWPWP